MGAPLRTVATVAAVSFLVQGIVWCVLSLLAILAFNCNFQLKYDQLDQSFTTMAKIYFADPSCWKGGEVIRTLHLTSPTEMITISSLQFVLNFFLSIFSLILLFVIPRRGSKTFLLWLYLFLFIWLGTAILDLVTVSVLSSDKNIISSGTSSIKIANGLINMLLISCLVAAKGYLYWALNFLIMIYLLIASTMKLFKACKRLDEPSMSTMRGNINAAFDMRGRPSSENPRGPPIRRLYWPNQRY